MNNGERNFLSFNIGSHKLAVDSSKIMGIDSIPSLTKVDGFSDDIRGVGCYREKLIYILDLHKRFNVDDLNNSLMIVSDCSNGDLIGISIDQINNLEYSLQMPYPLGLAKSGEKLFAGVIASSSKNLIPILNIDELVRKAIVKDN